MMWQRTHSFIAQLMILTLSGFAWFQNTPALSLLFFIVSTVFYIVDEVQHGQRAIFSLDCVLIGFYGLYVIAVPMNYLLTDQFDQISNDALGLCVLGQLGWITGFYFAHLSYSEQPSHEPQPTYYSHYHLRLVAWALMILGILSGFMAISATVGLVEYWQAGYAGRALLKREAGPIELGLYVTVVGIVLWFIHARLSGSWHQPKTKWLIIGFVIAFIAYVALLGIRRPSFMLIMSLMAADVFMGRQLKLFKATVIATFFIIVFGSFALYRQVLSDQGVLSALTYVADNASWTWLDLSKTELGAPFRSLTDVLEKWLVGDWFYGQTYVQAAPNILPSFLNIYQPSLSEQYTKLFFSEDFIAIGGNMGFFPVSEAYLNFSYLGPVFVFMMLGYALLRLIKWAECQYQNPLVTLLIALMVPWMVFFLRVDFSAIIKTFFYSVLVPYCMAYLLLTIWQKRALSIT